MTLSGLEAGTQPEKMFEYRIHTKFSLYIIFYGICYLHSTAKGLMSVDKF